MDPKLTHVIAYVADMDRAVRFYRDVVGLPLRFQSPGWSEFATGATTFALHAASDKNPAGIVKLGLTVPEIQEFHKALSGKGVQFTMPPTPQDFGATLADFLDSDGAHISVSSG